MAALFACTRCNSRHPFEDLSQGQQLCKAGLWDDKPSVKECPNTRQREAQDCRGAFPVVKCTYCRTEFQESTKSSTTSVCRKCEQNVKLYGKPAACEYCNIIAAFIGAKCQRCTNSEKKYGPPVTCEQCKQRCAFDRKDDSRKKVDGKLLCWLCTLSYKRALAKAKQNNHPTRHSSISLHKGSGHHRSASQNHKHSISHSGKTKNSEHLSPNKKPRLELNKSANGSLPSSESALLDPNSSDHMVALTQLKDQIATLQKQLAQKDQQMLAKEKQTAEIKAHHGILERELRLKIQEMNKTHGDLVQDLQSKVRVLQKQVVTLSKANKKTSTDSPLLL